MVDELKVSSMVADLVVEVREMRNAVTRMSQENRELERQLRIAKEKK